MPACAGSEQLLTELIKIGADVKVAAAGGVTALHVAAEGGDVGIVRSLLKVLLLANPSKHMTAVVEPKIVWDYNAKLSGVFADDVRLV